MGRFCPLEYDAGLLPPVGVRLPLLLAELTVRRGGALLLVVVLVMGLLPLRRGAARAADGLRLEPVGVRRAPWLLLRGVLLAAFFFDADGQKAEQMQRSIIKKIVKRPAAQAHELVVHLSG